MITTNDIKIKDQEPKKLTIISTGDVKPKEFVIKGKGKPRSEQMITTSNVDQFKHTPRKSVKKKEEPKLVEPSKELTTELTKKPWNKMNAKERKEHQAEKAKKAEAAEKKE